MADFKTHLIGAAAVSGVAATGLMMAGVVPEHHVIVYFILGTGGGLLPDVDSESSVPFRMAFNILGVVCAFLAVLALGQDYSLMELIIVWMVCFCAVRFGICSVFSRYTVHRGLIHSIPMGVVFALITVIAVYHFAGSTAMDAWMCGSFVFLGFLIHLILDEIYSVDLMGATIKRSFGSAFNLGSLSNPFATAMLYLAIVFLFFMGPRPNAFVDGLINGDYDNLIDRLLPQGVWFEGILLRILGSHPI